MKKKYYQNKQKKINYDIESNQNINFILKFLSHTASTFLYIEIQFNKLYPIIKFLKVYFL